MRFHDHGLCRCVFVFVLAVSFLGCYEVSFGQDQGATPAPEARRGAPTTSDRHPVEVPGLTARQQGDIKRFVRKNHPEIMKLLKRLQERHPNAYVNAMNSIAVSYRRLKNIEKNSPGRYDAALKRWTVRSRIKLLSARIAIKDTPERQQELKELVAEQIDLRIAQLQDEQARVVQRMEKIDKRLSRLATETESDREALIAREMKTAIRRSKKLMSGQKGKKSKQKKQNETESGDGSQ